MEDPATDAATKQNLQMVLEMTFDHLTKGLEEHLPEIRTKLMRKLQEIPAHETQSSSTRYECLPNQPSVSLQTTPPLSIKTEHIRQAETFMHRFPFQFRICHQARDNYYYKGTRVRCLGKLYEEGLHVNPIYIPRKFRQTKVHIRNENELQEITKQDMDKLLSEIRIFKGHENEFFAKANEQERVGES